LGYVRDAAIRRNSVASSNDHANLRNGREACAGDRQGGRTDRTLCLYLCSEDPDSAGMLPENAGATGPPVSRAGERRGEDFCCGLTKDLESRLAARGNIEEDPRRREAARAKGSGGKWGAPQTRDIRRPHWYTFWTGPSHSPRFDVVQKPQILWRYSFFVERPVFFVESSFYCRAVTWLGEFTPSSDRLLSHLVEQRPLVVAIEPREIDPKHARGFDDPQFIE
jgi:hypothetical protein